MSEWLAALVLWFVQLAGLKALPLPGTCEPVPGPTLVTAPGFEEHRAMCIDEFGVMREQGGGR
jgi:hypothetical protein